MPKSHCNSIGMGRQIPLGCFANSLSTMDGNPLPLWASHSAASEGQGDRSVVLPGPQLVPQLWNFRVFITETKSSVRGQTQLEAADGRGWMLCFGGSSGTSSTIQPLPLGPSEPWGEKRVKEHAGNITKTRSI